MMVRLRSVYWLTLFRLTSFSYGLQCVDEQGAPVDWYVAYKLPKQEHHENPFVRDGLGLVYMTSKTHDQWLLSQVDVNNSESLIGSTLNALYTDSKKENMLFILYNDEPPGGHKSFDKGHTKGVVVANETSGFWLIHSVPHFPYDLNSYVYPKTGTHYGQSFLCLSLGIQDLNSVGIQLQYNEPVIFAQNVPESLKKLMPELQKAANNQTVKVSPWYRLANITTRGGARFVSFAKSGKFGKDLYADLVSPSLGSNLYVETWPNEPNRLPSDCDHKFQVDNVLSISISNPMDITFTTTVDHSKWAVSTIEDTVKWLCIGDINRAEKQTLRGGGTACINNDALASQYTKIVSSVQQCQNRYFYDIE